MNLFIYGENHSDPNDNAVSWYVNGLMHRAKLIKFSEGMSGIEEKIGLYGLNTIGISGAYADLLLYIAQSNNPMFSKTINRHLAESLCFFKDVYINNNLKYFDDSFLYLSEGTPHACSVSVRRFLSRLDQKELLHKVKKIKVHVKNHVLNSHFKGIDNDKVDERVIQELREMEWIQIMNSAICSRGKDIKNFWAQVGKYHSSSLTCALKEVFVDENINLKSIEEKDIYFISRRNNIQDSLVDKINEFAKKNNIAGQVKIEHRDTYQGFLLNFSEVSKGKRKKLYDLTKSEIEDNTLEFGEFHSKFPIEVRWKFRDLNLLIKNEVN